ncbi:DUF1778 domain-containing protein [Enterobacter bugandensis]
MNQRFNIKAKESQRALIDLEMACQAAENVILDRRVFNVNDEQYAKFIGNPGAPVADDPGIRKNFILFFLLRN